MCTAGRDSNLQMLHREKSIEIDPETSIKLQSASDDEEECEHFFLQPASSPYNISEKVKQANEMLQNENYDSTRNSKVKFREQLVDYEPINDDDCSSDDSNEDINIVYTSMKNELQRIPSVPAPIERNSVRLNMLPLTRLPETEEAVEKYEEEIVDEEGEVIEEVETVEEVESVEEDSLDTADEVVFIEEETFEDAEESRVVEVKASKIDEVNVQHKHEKKKRKSSSTSNAKIYPSVIECEKHCIERLDFGLNLWINKLNIQEKPSVCPKLKLQQRKCCEKNKEQNPQQLPTYVGLRSEYGLNLMQLERRERRKEIIRQKQQARQKMLDEYKTRKIEQNEEVFRQWLKEVARRKEKCQTGKTAKTKKQSFAPNIVNLDVKYKKDRPKTAYNFNSKSLRPKKSRSCSARVYIQVPPDLLEKGVRVGELMISSANARDLRVIV